VIGLPNLPLQSRAWLSVPLGLKILSLSVAWQFLSIDTGFAQQDPRKTSDHGELFRELEVVFNRGQYNRVGQLDQVLSNYYLGEAEVRMMPKICESYARIGASSAALKRAQNLLGRFPENAEALWLVAHYASEMGETIIVKDALDAINGLAKEKKVRRSDPFQLLVLGKTALAMGADADTVLQGYFQPVTTEAPWLSDGWLASGELALTKRDFKRAAATFKAALKVHPTDPDLLVGLAKALQPSNGEAAKEALDSALKINPRHAEALLMGAAKMIDNEEYADAVNTANLVIADCSDHPKAWAHIAAVAIIRQNTSAYQEARKKGLARWEDNPWFDYTIGQRIARKLRFAEAAEAQRRALAMDPKFAPAKLELSQNLLRLGLEDEAFKLVAEIREDDPYSVVAYNLSILEKNLSAFEEVKDDHFVLKMPPIEAQTYGDRALELLRRARIQLGEKYGYVPEESTLVEFFPAQQDFAVRTLGVPGGEGLLGACFGSVVTMNSPGGVGAGLNNWEATLWHEMCHVITLGATENRMPRWLSEGISVYEERQYDPTWGKTMTPQFRSIILEGDGLVPLEALSGAFSGGVDIGFAYFQSSLVVEFIIERFGLPKLLEIMAQMRLGKTDEEAIRNVLGSLNIIDRDFATFAEKRARALAPNVDWSEPDAADYADTGAAVRSKPNNLALLVTHANELAQVEDWPRLERVARHLISLYPGYSGKGNPYEMLALARARQDDPQGERDALEQLAKISSEDASAFRRLMDIALKEGDWPAVEKGATRSMAINPMIPRLHYCRGCAEEATGKPGAAISSFQRWLDLGPSNPAEAHFRLGRLLIDNDRERARRHILDSLALAPRNLEGHEVLKKVREKK